MSKNTTVKERPGDRAGKRQKFFYLWRTDPVWIILVLLAVYIVLTAVIYNPLYYLILEKSDQMPVGLFHIIDNYSYTILSVLLLFLLTWLVKPSRYIWKSFLFPKKGAASSLEESDVKTEFYGRGRNGFKMLFLGLLLGFLTNGIGIVCALLHKDIRLVFDFSAAQIPLLLFALFSVFIQSSSEELWCRGFLYERLHERFPLWVAIAINGILFGLLHSFNPGVTALSILDIALCGISYSLLRWYSGNIWIAMGVHTGWNFMQAFLFGLPNSGLVSEVSLFRPESVDGVNNLFYNFEFGVEGGLPAVITDFAFGAIVLILAVRSGRVKELAMNYPKTKEYKKTTDATE